MRPAFAPFMAAGMALGVMRPESTPPHVRRRARQRAIRLKELGFESYGAYLRSSTWRVVKAHYRLSDRPQDCMCGATDVELHHVTYERVGGEELLADLVPLCPDCHRMVHVLERRGDIELDLKGLYDAQRARRNAHETVRRINEICEDQYGHLRRLMVRIGASVDLMFAMSPSRRDKSHLRRIRGLALSVGTDSDRRILIERAKRLSARLAVIEGGAEDSSPIQRDLEAIKRQLVRAEEKCGGDVVSILDLEQRKRDGVTRQLQPWHPKPARASSR